MKLSILERCLRWLEAFLGIDDWAWKDKGDSMRVQLVFAWYDLWVGLFWDAAKRRLYVFPIPCLGLRIDLASKKQRSADG